MNQMNQVVCVDSGLTLKLVLPEDDAVLATNLLNRWRTNGTLIIATDLWRYEVTSVIRNKTSRGILKREEEEDALAVMHNMPIEFRRHPRLHRRAWELARRFNRPAAYDSHHLALAEFEGCPFWTADERLFNAVHRELDWVHWLGELR